MRRHDLTQKTYPPVEKLFGRIPFEQHFFFAGASRIDINEDLEGITLVRYEETGWKTQKAQALQQISHAA